MADAVVELGPLTSKQGYSLTSTDRHGRRDEFLEGTLVEGNGTPGMEKMTWR